MKSSLIREKSVKEKFKKEFTAHKEYISIPLVKAKEISNNIIEIISEIKFNDVVVEISPLNSVKFKIEIDEETLITIIKPFEQPLDLEEDEIIFHIYINNECIISDAKNIYDLVNSIKEIEN